MLHWLFLFLFLGLSCLISILFANRQLLTLLVISEVILIIFFLIGLTVAGCYNIYYLLGFSFVILVLGGLELALNLLLLVM